MISEKMGKLADDISKLNSQYQVVCISLGLYNNFDLVKLEDNEETLMNFIGGQVYCKVFGRDHSSIEETMTDPDLVHLIIVGKNGINPLVLDTTHCHPDVCRVIRNIIQEYSHSVLGWNHVPFPVQHVLLIPCVHV